MDLSVCQPHMFNYYTIKLIENDKRYLTFKEIKEMLQNGTYTQAVNNLMHCAKNVKEGNCIFVHE